MSVRSLRLMITGVDKASGPLQDVSDTTEELHDTVGDTTEGVSDLSDTTSDFGYEASSGFDEASGAMSEMEHQTGEMTDSLANMGDRGSGAIDKLKNNMGKIAGAAGVAGGALEGLARTQMENIEATAQQAEMMGESEESVRDMISGMTDHTFSTEDAIGGMQRLRQSNVDSKEEMEELLPVFDEFADATGIEVAEGIDMADMALSRLGEDITDVEDHLDTLTHMQHNTTIGLSEIERASRYVGDDFRELGMGTDDLLLAMDALHEEGYRGRDIHEQLRDAVQEDTESQEDYFNNLNVAEDSLEGANSNLDEAVGLTSDLAETHEESYTPLMRLQQNISNLAYEYSHIIDIASYLSPVLLGLATVLGIVAAAKYVTLIPSIVAATGAMWGFTVALLANPLTWIVGLIIALGVAIWYLVDDWQAVIDTITGFFGDMVGGARDAWNDYSGIIGGIRMLVEGLGAVFMGVAGIVRSVVDFFVQHWRDGGTFVGQILHGIWNYFQSIFGFIVNLVRTVATAIWGIFTGDFEPLREAFGDLIGSIGDVFASIRDLVAIPVERAAEIFTGLRDTVGEVIDGIVEWFSNLPGRILEALSGFGESIGGFFSDALGGVRDLLPFSDAKEGPLSDLTASGESMIKTFNDGMASEDLKVEQQLNESMPDKVGAPGIEQPEPFISSEESYSTIDKLYDFGSQFLDEFANLINQLAQIGMTYQQDTQVAPGADPALAGAGGETIHISVGDINVRSDSADAQQVASEVRRTFRQELPSELGKYFRKERKRR